MASRMELTNKTARPLSVPVFATPLAVAEKRTYSPSEFETLRRQYSRLKQMFAPSVLEIDLDLAAGDSIEDPTTDNTQATERLTSRVAELESLATRLYNDVRLQAKAMSGDMVLRPVSTAENVSAAALNAAAAGSFKRTMSTRLETDLQREKHTWYYGPATVTFGETVADADVGAPTVQASPVFNQGAMLLNVTFDTGAGKTYVNGETVTVEVAVSATDELLGFGVASVTKTFNVIA